MSMTTLESKPVFTDKVRGAHLTEYWKVRSGFQPTDVQTSVVPHLWKWSDVFPLVIQSGGEVPVEDAERRALQLQNPGLKTPYVTNTLLAALQLILPGESAPCHRHTTNASRFVMHGQGGFTTIDGEKCPMTPGDLILTPSWSWHDHGNDGNEEVIWLDMLDVPLVHALDSSLYDFSYPNDLDSNAAIQTVTKSIDHSYNLYSNGGLLPKFVTADSKGRSPLLVYKWSDVHEALVRLKRHKGSPYDGILMEYTNPLTGASALSTLSFHVQLLQAKQQTSTHRHNSSTVYCVVRGHGSTIIDGKSFEWSERDVFVVPSWAWHSHVNLENEDAILYSVSDAPALEKLSLYWEQGRTENGDVVVISAP